MYQESAAPAGPARGPGRAGPPRASPARPGGGALPGLERRRGGAVSPASRPRRRARPEMGLHPRPPLRLRLHGDAEPAHRAQRGDRKASYTSREKNRGVFEFAAAPDRTAMALMKIQTVEVYMNDQKIPQDPEKKNQGSVSECVVTEDGATDPVKEKGLADARLYLESLFAVKPGTRELPPGRITTRMAGCFKVGRYECVRLESEFEMAAEKPSQHHLLRGRVVSFFALSERKFIRASAAVASSTRANAFAKEGVWSSSLMDAVTHYRVRFLESP